VGIWGRIVDRGTPALVRPAAVMLPSEKKYMDAHVLIEQS
jgi:hypothetical protein